jgi:hypothetical protein
MTANAVAKLFHAGFIYTQLGPVFRIGGKQRTSHSNSIGSDRTPATKFVTPLGSNVHECKCHKAIARRVAPLYRRFTVALPPLYRQFTAFVVVE